jgi:penicillin-binding protein 2
MHTREEQQTLRWRIRLLSYIMVSVFVVLVFGFWRHQMVYSSYYADRAEQNRIREIPLIAPRGRIYDRYNRLLADNRPSYTLFLIRENSPHTPEQTVAMLAEGIDMPVQDMQATVNRHKRDPKFRPIALKEDISPADMAFVKAHRYELPEISVEEQPRRRYPGGETAAHALGYVGEVTEAELDTPEFTDFKSGDLVGKTGLEREYDRALRGEDGFKRVIVNSAGREMGRLEEKEPIPGNDLHTTIDLDLQKAAEDALGDHAGAAVALDPFTGEVLAFVSKPSFDPNWFATRISNEHWRTLMDNPQKPLLNRASQSHFSPGSVFKVFESAAALEAGTLDPYHSVFCPGYAVFYGRTFHCDEKGGHGSISLHRAIVTSCDVFFYNVGKDLGIDRIAHYMTMFGLGRKSGIDLPTEDPGLIPSPEWKQRVYKTAWYAGETISVAIGQGAVGVTPLQAAWAMGGLTSGGRLKQPHFVNPEMLKKIGFEANEVYTEQYPIQDETVDIVTTGMWGVVNEPGGTGSKARVAGFDVAGKTGTAQVVGFEANLKGEAYKDNAWFVGVAPRRNPEIVVSAFIQNVGRGGIYSAPIAHAVLETYYKKKIGTFTGTPPTVAMNEPVSAVPPRQR